MLCQFSRILTGNEWIKGLVIQSFFYVKIFIIPKAPFFIFVEKQVQILFFRLIIMTKLIKFLTVILN